MVPVKIRMVSDNYTEVAGYSITITGDPHYKTKISTQVPANVTTADDALKDNI